MACPRVDMACRHGGAGRLRARAGRVYDEGAMQEGRPLSWIGWADAGAVERLGPEAIVTSFWHVVMPLRAGKSFYRYRTFEGEAGRFEVPRHRQSVVLGYVRTPLWLAAIIFAAPALFGAERWALLPIGVALAAAAAALTFVAGRLSPGERERRALLRRVSGLGAPPELLPPSMRDEIREHIADAWFHERRIDWRGAIYRGDASEVLVALADYYQTPPLLIRARTNLIDAEGN